MIDALCQKVRTQEVPDIIKMQVGCLVSFYSKDALLYKQIYANLKNSLDLFGKEFYFDMQKLTKIQELIKLLEGGTTNIQEIKSIFASKLKEEINDHSEFSVLLNDMYSNYPKVTKTLELWSKFLDHIYSKDKIISQEERLDQEQFLYFDI